MPGASNGAKIGIITFDRVLHFFDLRGENTPNVQFVPDVDEPFIPMGSDAFFGTPERAIAALETINNVFSVYSGWQSTSAPPPPSDNALGAALIAAKHALSEVGGKVLWGDRAHPSVEFVHGCLVYFARAEG